MKKTLLSFFSFLARILPLSFKQALYRFPLLAKLLRGSINAAAEEGLTVIQVAAGALKGYRVQINLKTEKSRWLGTYEPDLQAALPDFVRPEQVIYDVGANIGYISLMFARLAGANAKIYAFEALPANLERIRANLELNHAANVQLIHAAVLNASGEALFYVHESIGMGKAAGSAGRRAESYKAELKVPALSLDDFVFLQGNPPPHLVKMDIEGGEVLALPGMRRILAEHAPTLLLELHGPEAEAIAWQTLTAAGYTLRQMSSGYPLIASAQDLGWKAYVLARKE